MNGVMKSMTKKIWRRAALVVATASLLIGGAALPASAAAGSFTGTANALDESTALQLALANAQQKASAAGFTANQCAITDEGWDYLPATGGYLATVTLGCATTPATVAVPDVVGLLQNSATTA
jgi:hypothetical protein